MVTFSDRVDAGRQLGALLGDDPSLQHPDMVVVAGLPRGGVPVAAEVARALDAALDVLVVRKIGVPGRPELAMGAAGEDGVVVLNPQIVHATGLDTDGLAPYIATAHNEVAEQARRLRPVGQLPASLRDKTVVLVDDGVATGATARAAAQVARARGAARVLLAVPVAPPEVVAALRTGEELDAVSCLHAPANFGAVGQFYADFTQVNTAQVSAILTR